MCPEDKLLSAFYDGEVTSPWKEKIEGHLKVCDKCRLVVGNFSSQSDFLQSDSEPEVTTSFNDIQKLIRHKNNTSRGVFDFTPLKKPIFPIAAAAAAVLAFFLGFGLSGNPGPGASYSEMPLAVSDGWSVPPGNLTIPGENMESMKSLINPSDSSMFNQETSLILPGDLSLAFHGDPQLLKSASYAGGSSH